MGLYKTHMKLVNEMKKLRRKIKKEKKMKIKVNK